jgi:hypothetical protein
MGWTNILSKCLLHIYVNQHAFILFHKILIYFLMYSEFHKQNWKLRHQPTSNQVDAMRRDGINWGGGVVSSPSFEIM